MLSALIKKNCRKVEKLKKSYCRDVLEIYVMIFSKKKTMKKKRFYILFFYGSVYIKFEVFIVCSGKSEQTHTPTNPQTSIYTTN